MTVSWICMVMLLTSSMHVTMTSEDDVEVKLTRLDTIFLPPSELPPRGINEVAFDPVEKLFYCVSAQFINVVDASDPSNLTIEATIPYPDEGSLGLTIKICGDKVHVGADTSPRTSPRRGVVYTFDKLDRATGTMSLSGLIDYGDFMYPRNIQLTPDCQTMIVALENFPDFNIAPGKIKDLPGMISTVKNPNGKYRRIKNQGFQKFDDKLEELRKQGVRFVNNSNTLSEDIEPSFIVLDDTGRTAFHILQETNAVAIQNLETGSLEIVGLGTKDWNKFAFDPSSKDGGIHLNKFNVSSFYQPDRASFVRFREEEYIFMSNEGMSQRVTVSTSDEIRGMDIPDDEIAENVPQSLRDQLKDEAQLGQLRFSTVDGRNADGKFEKFFHFGGRSCSIRRARDMRLVFDTGSDFEAITGRLRPDIYNTRVFFDRTLKSTFDSRSPSKGPEPEGLATGFVNDTLLFFCSMERPGQIFVYSVQRNIRKPKFQALYFEGVPQDSNRTIQDLFDNKMFFDLDPEDIQFFEPGVVADYGVLSVGGGFSNTLTLIRVDVIRKEPEKYVPPPDDAPISAFFGDAFRWLYTQTICNFIGVTGCAPDEGSSDHSFSIV